MIPKNIKLGIFNLGNTCYINVIMQILFNCDDLNNYVFSNDFFHDLKRNENFDSLLYKYHVIIKKLMGMRKKGRDIKKIQPIEFISKFRNEFSQFSFHQQDAHEGCIYMIDNFHNSIATPTDNLQELFNNKLNFTNQSLVDYNIIEHAFRSWSRFYTKDYSKILDIFFGQFINTSICKTCQNEHISFEPYNNLQLGIENSETLLNCLDNYFKEETIDDYFCDNCNSKQQCIKDHKIISTPEYLIIQLKRFVYDERRGNFNKLFDNIHFPNFLDLNSYSKYEHSDNFYKLVNIVNHSGNSNGGHYYSYSKFNDTWFDINDEFICEINENKIFTKNCYMLVYKRFMK